MIALNAPYKVDDASDYAIPVHGEQRGIPHVLIELRNDLIAEAAGQQVWAGRLADALSSALRNLEISQ
jgi:predicted N-formylglutamate amidohydrolase